MVDAYEDIIDLPYEGVKNRQKMSLNDRAGQFSPFEALFDNDDLHELAETLQRIPQDQD